MNPELELVAVFTAALYNRRGFTATMFCMRYFPQYLGGLYMIFAVTVPCLRVPLLEQMLLSVVMPKA